MPMPVTPRLSISSALVLVLLLSPTNTRATDAIENQARAAGVKIAGCLDCHASQHSREEMARRARAVGFDARNCQGCHGQKLAGKLSDRQKLSDRGLYLMARKDKEKAQQVDGAWLKDYVPPPASTK